MQYLLRFDAAISQLVRVEVRTQAAAAETVFHLPKWRPGRYELQHYERNVADVRAALTADGTPLPIEKRDTHTWVVKAAPGTDLCVRYLYYANALDAGGSFVSAHRVYLNPVNMLLYRTELIDAPCELHLELPPQYQVACGLAAEAQAPHRLRAGSYHELADSPLLAAADLQHHSFKVQEAVFHLWFLGECAPHFPRIEADFAAFTEAQMAVFGGHFPVPAYHYLCIMQPQPFRHGVEHQASTVIAMGPGWQLHSPVMYRSFVELCSHELFHTWNVKAMRPAEMLPYDYAQPPYSRLHYITEGITTYYGDLMVWKAGLWTFEEWLHAVNGEIETHYKSGGKYLVSLEEASFDSWVRGYNQEGFPNRRISFYTKGFLVAMCLDTRIRKATQHRASLDMVLRRLYETTALQGRGYTAEDFWGIVADLTQQDFGPFYEAYIARAEPMAALFQEMSTFYGLKFFDVEEREFSMAHFGFATDTRNFVSELYPGSPAEVVSLAVGAEIMSIEGLRVEGNLNELLRYFAAQRRCHADGIRLHYFLRKRLHEVQLPWMPGYRRAVPRFEAMPYPSEAQLQNRLAWQTCG